MTKAPPAASCVEQPGHALGGSWHAAGTVIELDTDVSDVYVPNGLDDVVFDIDFLFGEQSEGVCALVYSGSSANLDTTSPIGGPSTLFGLGGSTLPNGVFGLDGLLYFPGGDVTTSLSVDFTSLLPLSDSSFLSTIEFEVYEGDQIAVVIDNIPGEDDDGDGEIDEADENEPGDGIAPDAVLLCRGRMQLSITRIAPLVASDSGSTTTTIPGVLRAIDGAIVGRAQVTVDSERALVLFEMDELVSTCHTVRLPAPIDLDGNFAASLAEAETRIELSGWLDEGALSEAVVRVHSAAGDRTLRLEPSSATALER